MTEKEAIQVLIAFGACNLDIGECPCDICPARIGDMGNCKEGFKTKERVDEAVNMLNAYGYGRESE